VLITVASVSEVIVIFLQLILFANPAAFFCSYTNRLFIPIALSKIVFFYAYSAIVDSFMTVFFFLEKHYIPQYYLCLTS